jgi:ribosomal-protein-alanine N-acetyltransferase
MTKHLAFPPLIETTRLYLRRLRYEDAEEIFYAYASKPEATRYVSWPTHRRIADTRQYLRYAVGAWNAGTDFAYAIRVKGSARLAGSIGAVLKGSEVQVGYIISPALWGSGLATEACKALGNVLLNMKGLTRVWTLVDADNKASVRVLEKCGWKCEGLKPAYFAFVNQNNQLKDCYLFVLASPD